MQIYIRYRYSKSKGSSLQIHVYDFGSLFIKGGIIDHLLFKEYSLICEMDGEILWDGEIYILSILSAESQKGAIADQRCSVENQKGAIAIDFVQR